MDTPTNNTLQFIRLVKFAEMNLTDTPAAAPPAGARPNFVDPKTGTGATIAVYVVMLSLVLIVVSGRLYHGACVLRSFGPDDCA